MTLKTSIVVTAFLCASSSVLAQSADSIKTNNEVNTSTESVVATSDNNWLGIGVTVDYALLFGLGVSGSYAFIPEVLNGRAVFHPGQRFNITSITQNGFEVTPTVKFGNFGVYADWFPFEGGFRLSGGLASMNQVNISVTGQKSANLAFGAATANGVTTLTYAGESYTLNNGDTYTINGDVYTINNGVLVSNTPVPETIDLVATIGDINTSVSDLRINAEVKYKSIVP